MASAVLMVRVSCGTNDVIGSSTVSSSALIRLAMTCICSIVLLKFSTREEVGDTPLELTDRLGDHAERVVPAEQTEKVVDAWGVLCVMAAP